MSPALDEYDRTQTQIDEALALAKETATDLKEAAEREAEAVLSQARVKAQEILISARRQAEEETVRIQRLRREAAQYRAGVERAAEEFLLRLDQLYDGAHVPEYETALRQVAAGLDEDLEERDCDDFDGMRLHAFERAGRREAAPKVTKGSRNGPGGRYR